MKVEPFLPTKSDLRLKEERMVIIIKRILIAHMLRNNIQIWEIKFPFTKQCVARRKNIKLLHAPIRNGLLIVDTRIVKQSPIYLT